MIENKKDIEELFVDEEEKEKIENEKIQEEEKEIEPKLVIDEILEDLKLIKESINEASEALVEDFNKIKKGLQKLLSIGLPRDLIETYIARRSGLNLTTTRKIIRAIRNPRYDVKDLLIYYIAKMASVKTSDARRFIESYEALLKDLTKKKGE